MDATKADELIVLGTFSLPPSPFLRHRKSKNTQTVWRGFTIFSMDATRADGFRVLWTFSLPPSPFPRHRKSKNTQTVWRGFTIFGMDATRADGFRVLWTFRLPPPPSPDTGSQKIPRQSELGYSIQLTYISGVTVSPDGSCHQSITLWAVY